MALIYTGKNTALKKPLVVTSKSCNTAVVYNDFQNQIENYLAFGILDSSNQLNCLNNVEYPIVASFPHIKFQIQTINSDTKLEIMNTFEGYLYVKLQYIN